MLAERRPRRSLVAKRVDLAKPPDLKMAARISHTPAPASVTTAAPFRA